MDIYGSLTISKDDAKTVKTALAQASSAVFCLSTGTGTALIVFICTQFETIGAMSFGGNPIGRAYVGIYGRGCNHLPMEKVHPEYIAEKLGIELPDATPFSDFWGLIWIEENK